MWHLRGADKLYAVESNHRDRARPALGEGTV